MTHLIHYMLTICHNLQFKNSGLYLCASAFASRSNLQFQLVVNGTLSKTKVAFEANTLEPEY